MRQARMSVWGVIGAMLLSGCGSPAESSHQESHQELRQVADQFNRMCPMALDQVMVLDSVTLLKDTLQYNFTVQPPIDSLEIIVKRSFFEIEFHLKQNAEKQLKTDSELSYFREHKTPLKYDYRDRQGNPLFSFAVQYRE